MVQKFSKVHFFSHFQYRCPKLVVLKPFFFSFFFPILFHVFTLLGGYKFYKLENLYLENNLNYSIFGSKYSFRVLFYDEKNTPYWLQYLPRVLANLGFRIGTKSKWSCRGSATYTKITNAVHYIRGFGLCMRKWGISVLVGDLLQSH